MKCPIDSVELVMSERSGIEIDYCPQCRGVWLDRGELDKLIDKNTVSSPQYQERQTEYNEPKRQNNIDDYKYDNHHKKRRKESFLGDFFDF